MKKYLFLLSIITILFSSCSENFSNGERIGTVTRFSQKGFLWKSWEGTLNITQTGMNTSGEPFNFSVDNDQHENARLIGKIDSAANQGWKVKIIYHQTIGKNWFGNRGETNYFINDIIVLDSNFSRNTLLNPPQNTSGIHDTIYVVIRK